MTPENRPVRRPTRTQDLLQRLKSADSTEKEKHILHELCQCMVNVFNNEPEPKPIYIAEAAALAPVLRYTQREKLLVDLATTLGNAIIKGTADGNIERASFLKAFAYVLWHTKDIPSIRSVLISVLRSLSTRLKDATKADREIQYLLVCSISAILDSMVDIKLSGLSRENLHEPLLKQLKDLTKDEDVRLAQASSYAYQALLGVKNDESPLEALWRYTRTTVQNGANIAGAVSSMNPGALLQSLPSASSIIDLIQELIDAGKNVAEIMKNIGDIKEQTSSILQIHKQKNWYKGLRCLELLLQLEAWSDLECFVEQAPYREEVQFQCGLYSEIEKAWKIADHVENISGKDKLTALYCKISSTLGSTNPTVQAWVGIVGTTMGKSAANPTNLSQHSWLWKPKSYSTNLEVFFRWPTLEPNDKALLRDTWLSADSMTVKVLYADLVIEEHYKLSKRLHIERLSGKLLPMDKCYINLAIQDTSVTTNTEHEKTTFSLEARLRLEAGETDGNIELQDLFKQRQQAGKTINPRRIFIQGRAGVGKTTLCKKLVHEYLNGTLCSGEFDRLLWLPLRKLQATDEKYIWQQLLADELSKMGNDAEILAKAFANQLDDNQTFCKRTLFLLDGLDEIALRWPESSHMHRFLMKLLTMPSVIVTSRPQAKSLDIGNFDLELETVGFLPDQVQEYLQHCIIDKSTIARVNDFLRMRPLIRGLVRIPIQLDAFCYTWLSQDHGLATEPNTMTKLYHSICTELSKKDILRLEKAKELHSNNITLLDSFEVEEILQHEQRYLEVFAFQGLYNNIIEFGYQHQKIIGEYLYKLKVRPDGPFKIVLEKLSFLRSSGLEDTQHRHVHFLHLTFQEFFAARYFVSKWQHDKEISCLKLDPAIDAEDIMPKAFLQREKYNPRYHVFWRFVVGLMQLEGKSNTCDNTLQAFFDTLELPPQDLLGYSHHRLLMYSLSEITQSNNKTTNTLQEKIQRQLYHWSLLEAKTFPNGHNNLANDTRYLAHELEFPESVLYELLSNTYLQNQNAVSESLISGRPPYPTHMLWKVCTDLLADPCQDVSVLRYVLRAMAKITFFLPEEVVYSMLPLLGCSDEIVRDNTKRILANVKLPSETTRNLLSVIKHSPYLLIEHVSPYRVSDFSRNLPPLSKDNLIELINLIDDQDRNMGNFAMSILHGLCQRQSTDIIAIFDKIGIATKKALATYSMCYNEGREVVFAALLQDASTDIRYKTLETIKQSLETIRPGKILQALLSMIHSEDFQTRLNTILALRNCTLTEETQHSLLLLLKQSDARIQEAACTALSTSRHLSQDNLNYLLEMLTESDNTVCKLGARVLTLNSCLLSESNLRTLCGWLKQEDSDLHKWILPIFRYLCPLPLDILRTLLTMIQSANDETFEASVEATKGGFHFTEETTMIIELWLEGSSLRLRMAATTICKCREKLPESVSAQLVKLLVDECNRKYPETEAAETDLCESKSSDNIIQQDCNVNKDYDLRIPALEALMKRNSSKETFSSQQVFDACIQWLNDKDPTLRKVSAEFIGSQAYVSPEMWPRLLASVYQFREKEGDYSDEDAKPRSVHLQILEAMNVYYLSWPDNVICKLAHIAIELLEIPWSKIQRVGARILREGPELGTETIEALTNLWLCEGPQRDSFPYSDEWYIQVLARQAALPDKTIESLVRLFAMNCKSGGSFGGKEDRFGYEQLDMLRIITRMLIRQISQGNLASSVIVELIQLSCLEIREIILLELITQDIEHELASLLSNEILELLCVVYLRRASVIETYCYSLPDGIYIHKGNKVERLNLNPEQQNNFIQILAKVKMECGFVEPM